MFCGVDKVNAETVVLRDQSHLVLTDGRYSLFRDKQNLSVHEIVSKFAEFEMQQGTNPNFGFGDDSVWLKFDIVNESDDADWVFELSYAQNDLVDLYVLHNEKVIAEDRLGRLYNDTEYRYPILKFSVEQGNNYQLLARVKNATSRIAPMHLTEESRFHQRHYVEGILWGGFYGGLFLLLIFNFILFIGWKKNFAFLYVAYFSQVLLWEFVWGGHVQTVPIGELGNFLIKHTDLAFLALAFSAAHFTMAFLETKQYARISHRLILACTYFQLIFAGLTLSGLLEPALLSQFIYALAMLSMVLLFIGACESYKNKFQFARYFIFAWGIVLISALVGLGSLFGLVPSNQYVAYCFQVAVTIEACLFSLAVASRMRGEMAEEVQTATSELINNFEFIESQNVALDIARKDAMQASKIKTQFLANMSHEIRTPLNVIVGFSRQLQKSKLAESEAEMAHIINSSASHLADVVNDILDVSKIEAGKIEFESQPFNLAELTQELASIYAPQIFSKYVEFLYQYDLDNEIWIGDVTRVRQIITNILSNAIKFTDSGMIALKVRESSKGNPLIAIEDTGIGMSAAQQEKVFEAFAQGDNSTTRKFGGTGLGLLIARELCHMMDGEICIVSEVNRGTTVVAEINLQKTQQDDAECLFEQQNILVVDAIADVQAVWCKEVIKHGGNAYTSQTENWQQIHYDLALVGYNDAIASTQLISEVNELPCEKVALVSPTFDGSKIPDGWLRVDKPAFFGKIIKKLNQQESAEEYLQTTSLDDLLNGFSILVADDMPLNMRLIGFWLDNSGARIVRAENGLEAVDLAQKQAFDLILMDVQMPELDGVEATACIRKDSQNMSTPIIAVTAHAFKGEIAKMKSAGMDDVLSKPLDESEFIRVLVKWSNLDLNTPPAIDIEKVAEPNQNVSIDWQYALTHSNNNEDIAKSILQMFIDKLPEHINEIKSLQGNKKNELLLQAVHKFHGACCYTGVPQLRSICFKIESALKSGKNETDSDEDLASLFDRLYQEANRIPPLAQKYLN